MNSNKGGVMIKKNNFNRVIDESVITQLTIGGTAIPNKQKPK